MFAAEFNTESILPAPPPGATPILHDREYRVRAYRIDADRIEIHGAVRDQKPPGLYLPDDDQPLTVHHMQLGLTIAFPQLEIVDVTTRFETFPAESCPSIIPHYEHLVGLSIARGFTHKVRELFGGPRGCTHTTALLQAMAPVAMQCFWSMRAAQASLDGGDGIALFDIDETSPQASPGDEMWRLSVNTCHVWDENGPAVAAREANEPHTLPVFLRERAAELRAKKKATSNE